MSVLDRLSSSLGRSDDLPNKELAAELARTENAGDVAELVAHLTDRDRNLASDCIKALYETGYIAPELIASHVDAFLSLLQSKDNRMVWGGMIALSTIAPLQPDVIYRQIDLVLEVIEAGSVITVDAGVSVLAHVAAANQAYGERLIPYLLNHLSTCRAKSVAQHAERIAVAIDATRRPAFEEILARRAGELSAGGQARVRRLVAK